MPKKTKLGLGARLKAFAARIRRKKFAKGKKA
jgi:hypothetical protein